MMKKDERDDFGSILEAASRDLVAQIEQEDPLGMIAFERSELAIAVIAAMCGRNIRQILREKSKSDSDPDVLKELHEKGSLYRKEKEAVYRGNIEVQEHVIRDYAPILWGKD